MQLTLWKKMLFLCAFAYAIASGGAHPVLAVESAFPGLKLDRCRGLTDCKEIQQEQLLVLMISNPEGGSKCMVTIKPEQRQDPEKYIKHYDGLENTVKSMSTVSGLREKGSFTSGDFIVYYSILDNKKPNPMEFQAEAFITGKKIMISAFGREECINLFTNQIDSLRK